MNFIINLLITKKENNVLFTITNKFFKKIIMTVKKNTYKVKE